MIKSSNLVDLHNFGRFEMERSRVPDLFVHCNPVVGALALEVFVLDVLVLLTFLDDLATVNSKVQISSSNAAEYLRFALALIGNFLITYVDRIEVRVLVPC